MENLKIKIKKEIDNELDHNWSKLQKNSNCSIFQYLNWIKKWKNEISNKDNKSSTLFVEIYLKDILIIIVPLQLVTKLGFRVLKIAGRPFSDYSDIILDKDYIDLLKQNNKVLFKEILSNISIDLVHFENIIERSDLYFLLSDFKLQTHNYKSYQLIKKKNHKILPNKFINDTYRQIKRLNELGKLEFRTINNFEEKKNFFNFFVSNKEKQLIETNNWNYLRKNNYLNFLKEIFLDNENSDIVGLYINNKLIAGHMGFKNSLQFFYLFPTYDRKFSKYSPGNIVLFNLTKLYFENNGETFDLTTGDERYKIKISNNIKEILFLCKSYSVKGYILKLIINFYNSIKKFKNFFSKN